MFFSIITGQLYTILFRKEEDSCYIIAKNIDTCAKTASSFFYFAVRCFVSPDALLLTVVPAIPKQRLLKNQIHRMHRNQGCNATGTDRTASGDVTYGNDLVALDAPTLPMAM